MDNREKLIEKLRKLHALANRGVGGERTNAEVLLKDLCSRNKITLEELEDNFCKEISVEINEKFSFLFLAIACKVIGYKRFKTVTYNYTDAKKVLNHIHMIVTMAEKIEIVAMFDYFKPGFEEELTAFNYAFVSKNDLMFDPGSEKLEQPNDEEKEKGKKMIGKMKIIETAIDKLTFRKALS